MRVMADESALAAAAAIVKSLAASPKNPSPVPIGTDSEVKLPGPHSSAKEDLERELSALVVRVQQLETKASTANGPIFPETPNETAESPFGEDSPVLAGKPSIRAKLPGLRNGCADDKAVVRAIPLTDEALDGLAKSIDDQSRLLDNQRHELTSVNEQLLEQKRIQEEAFHAFEMERVATLERELYKHQQANEAFQKALREIGEIITAVARGNLTMKVRMNTVDVDPEITTFKRTINTMMDQLQAFASEVSRVAREVGTDGILGGQAMIHGVDGTWKELTDNGTNLPSDGAHIVMPTNSLLQ